MRKKYLNTFLLSIATLVLMFIAIKIGSYTFNSNGQGITSNKHFEQVKEGKIRSAMPLWHLVARRLLIQN
jgi:hypothetical protein